MNKAYVSEFEIFMKHYQEEHPDTAKEQELGWKFYWGPQAIPPIDKPNRSGSKRDAEKS